MYPPAGIPEISSSHRLLFRLPAERQLFVPSAREVQEGPHSNTQRLQTVVLALNEEWQGSCDRWPRGFQHGETFVARIPVFQRERKDAIGEAVTGLRNGFRPFATQKRCGQRRQKKGACFLIAHEQSAIGQVFESG
ncbi:MAG TPA: hypothetical protein VF713_07435 [Thermoanaerobaculia bacterium]